MAPTIKKIITRDFILCSSAHFAFSLVLQSLIPTLPIYLSRLKCTDMEIGVLIGIFMVSSLILRPFLGRALLKIPEKTFMIIGALVFAISSVAYLFAPPFWPFLAVRAFQGIGLAFFHTASFTFIANISSGTNRGQTLSYFFLSSTIASALAPPIGIFIINHFNFTLLFLVCLGLSLCSLIIAYQLRKRQIAPSQDTSIEEESFLSRKALSPSITNAFSLFAWGALATFFPLYAIEQGVSNPGLFFTAIAITLLLGRVLGGKRMDFYSRERIILLCLITTIISMVILAFSKTLPMFILVGVIWGMGYAFLNPSLVAYALDLGVSPGPVMGMFTAISDLGLSLGPVIMGVILQQTNYPIMFLCLALTGILNLNYFYFSVRKGDSHSTDGFHGLDRNRSLEIESYKDFE
jgi:predicted MFS family arabinose efflux permease